jgi:hypothetical protein
MASEPPRAGEWSRAPLGDAAAVEHGAIAYGEAKAEYDAVISELAVALAWEGLPQRRSGIGEGTRDRANYCPKTMPTINARPKTRKPRFWTR